VLGGAGHNPEARRKIDAALKAKIALEALREKALLRFAVA
jgi:hypothetical protein